MVDSGRANLGAERFQNIFEIPGYADTFLSVHQHSGHLKEATPIVQGQPCDLSCQGCGTLEKPGTDPQATPWLGLWCTGHGDEKGDEPVVFFKVGWLVSFASVVGRALSKGLPSSSGGTMSNVS